MMLTALAVFPFVESITNRLDDLNPRISDFHHGIAPIDGAAPAPPNDRRQSASLPPGKPVETAKVRIRTRGGGGWRLNTLLTGRPPSVLKNLTQGFQTDGRWPWLTNFSAGFERPKPSGRLAATCPNSIVIRLQKQRLHGNTERTGRNMTCRTAEEARDHYTEKMGEALGTQFAALWQEIASLHVKWSEYIALFGTNPTRVQIYTHLKPASQGKTGLGLDFHNRLSQLGCLITGFA